MMKEIFKILNLNLQNGLYSVSEADWHGILSERTENILKNIIKPDAFFLLNNEPFILFFENPVNKEHIFKNSWNLNLSPIIFIISESEIEIYNGLSFLKEERSAAKLPMENWQENYSYFNIVSGKTWEQFAKNEFSENSVDKKLLENIKAVRNVLKDEFKLSTQVTNNLIGRLIFIRYLIDRHVVIGFESTNDGRMSNEQLCQILTSPEKTFELFAYIKEKFNGNLFPVLTEEKENVNKEHLHQLVNLLQGTEISTGQMSLFDIYDFSIIPIELISNVYEFFIGQAEQESKGAYYTPMFLVKNILSETVNKYFDNNPQEYNCKILDPACGSGVFLVETLRKIITQHQINTPDFHHDIDVYKSKVKQLLSDNIFGIDKDPNAVNVAIFSLYVTLLDYLQPPEIVNFKFPPLLNKNFFVADFFDVKAEFNTAFKEIQFDFIIGNPPWGTIKESATLYENYWKNREKSETELQKKNNPEYKGKVEIKVSNKEIALVFLIRVSDFKFTECAFIVTSKVLYNLKAKTFRRYFLENFVIRKVFELSSVRHEVFDKSNDPANCPASILYYAYSTNKEKNKQNLVTHISLKPNRFFELFKMLTVEKHDQKQLFQSYFMEYDWIWKVLVYGNILDFYLIKRLNEFQTIREVTSNTTEFTVGQGLKRTDGNNRKDASFLIGREFLDTNKNKELQQFYIKPHKLKWTENTVGYLPKKIDLFEAPCLFIKEGTDNEFNSVSAISYKNVVFTSSITAFKALDIDGLYKLKAISGLFNSSLFAFYMVSIGSSVGIEREQTHDDEKFDFPYNSSPKLVDLVSSIEKAAKQKHEAELQLSEEYVEAEKKYNQHLAEIDKEIYGIYQISSQEKALIDFAHEISIPLIKRRDKQRIFGELNLQTIEHKEYLLSYAKIFIEHFNNIYNSDGLYFEVEVWHSYYMIGMLFKVIHSPSEVEEQIIWKQDTETQKLLKRFSAISISQQSNELFIQKDIKGFEEEAFYVIKPNEYKNWHRALAYLDLSEFIDAMMQGAKEEAKL